MVGVSSPVGKSASMSRLHAVSPSQVMARKLVRKYSMGSRQVHQRKELTALRTSMPDLKAASDLEVVLAAIKYIEDLQNKVMYLSRNNINTIPEERGTTSHTNTNTTTNTISNTNTTVDNIVTGQQLQKKMETNNN